jgi:hypothetical protein
VTCELGTVFVPTSKLVAPSQQVKLNANGLFIFFFFF